MKKYMNSHTTGKLVPIDDAMIELSNKLLPALGYVIRDECSLRLAYPDRKHSVYRCVETEKLDHDWGKTGVLISPSHQVYVITTSGVDGPIYQWPEEVMKAAHAIDRSKPAVAKR